MKTIIYLNKLSARVRQIIKLWNITDLVLNDHCAEYAKIDKKKRSVKCEVVAHHYADPYGSQIQLIPSALGLTELTGDPLPEHVEFQFEEKPEYKGLGKINDRRTILRSVNGGKAWTDGYMMVFGPITGEEKHDITIEDYQMDRLCNLGETVTIDMSATHGDGLYKFGNLFFDAKYIDFIVKNTSKKTEISFRATDHVLQIMGNGQLFSAVMCCGLTKEAESALETRGHKIPKQPLNGILWAPPVSTVVPVIVTVEPAPVLVEIIPGFEPRLEPTWEEVKKMIHTPAVDNGFDPSNAIKIVADDIYQLRPVDVFRLLDSVGPENMEAMRLYIIKYHGTNQRINDELLHATQELRQEIAIQPEAPATPEETQIIKFEVGKTYWCRSICDYECIYERTIAKRTAKTITTTDGKTFRPGVWHGEETFYPNGRYSMSAMITAGKCKESPQIALPSPELAEPLPAFTISDGIIRDHDTGAPLPDNYAGQVTRYTGNDKPGLLYTWIDSDGDRNWSGAPLSIMPEAPEPLEPIMQAVQTSHNETPLELVDPSEPSGPEIISEETTEYGHYITATIGKVTADVSINSCGMVTVTIDNASHRAWRGAGRTFANIQDALDAYKSPGIKAIIGLLPRRPEQPEPIRPAAQEPPGPFYAGTRRTFYQEPLEPLFAGTPRTFPAQDMATVCRQLPPPLPPGMAWMHCAT